MHKSKLGDLVIDCEGGDIDAHARFWAGLLGRKLEEAPKNPRYRRLIGEHGEAGILLQSADHPPRVHLDIETDNIEKEVERLEGLGAKIFKTFPSWIVMEAPTGHRFCVVSPQLQDFEEKAKTWED